GTVLGDTTATVQIVEYADYQCPFCAEFANEVVPQLIEDFVEPGLVTFEFRAFPFLGGEDLTNPENESVQAAEAAMCALDQGQFWQYNHLLFERHDGENQGAFSNENLKAFAGELGLDTTAFDACLDGGQHQQTVLDDFAAGQAAGIDSTPTIFINGQAIAYTTQGYDLLKRQIQAAIDGVEIPLS
ncbi:MAG TPA: thioredoxin domain-containing protein, partial [Thermomicrobiales bacterium]|nr:thioredoxin domain-containing protein [Thermomicrobiales bacterium]